MCCGGLSSITNEFQNLPANPRDMNCLFVLCAEIAPPTIAHLKDHGLEGLFVACLSRGASRSANPMSRSREDVGDRSAAREGPYEVMFQGNACVWLVNALDSILKIASQRRQLRYYHERQVRF
jgi:hypothetical protein